MSVEPLKLKQERQHQKLADLKAVNEKIYKLEERLINNEIENETYQRWFKKLKEEKANLEYEMRDDKKSKLGSTEGIVERLLPELSNIHQIYDKGNITQKHTLIKGVFKDNLSWGEGMFRTTFIDPIFNDNLLKINKKGLLFYEQSSSFLDRNPFSTQGRDRTGTVSHWCLRPTRLPIPPPGHLLVSGSANL